MTVGERRIERELISRALLPCTVVYVHPEKWYYTVRFDFRHGSYNESYILRDKARVLSDKDLCGIQGWPKMERDWRNTLAPWENSKYRGKILKGDKNAEN